MRENLAKYLVEFIGTFFLVFVVATVTFLTGNDMFAPIMIGFTLMVMVYAGGHISGGHYNPAVSFAAAIRGALSWKQLLPYWISQILGCTCAALLMKHFAVVKEVSCTNPYTVSNLMVGELLFTFALCYVVLNVATSKATEGNSFYGLAIGSTVTAGALAVGGGLCYAAFNPAVIIGLGVTGVVCIKCITLTVLANLLAGAVAAFVFKFVNKED